MTTFINMDKTLSPNFYLFSWSMWTKGESTTEQKFWVNMEKRNLLADNASWEERRFYSSQKRGLVSFPPNRLRDTVCPKSVELPYSNNMEWGSEYKTYKNTNFHSTKWWYEWWHSKSWRNSHAEASSHLFLKLQGTIKAYEAKGLTTQNRLQQNA